jgi:hypothetical protein
MVTHRFKSVLAPVLYPFMNVVFQLYKENDVIYSVSVNLEANSASNISLWATVNTSFHSPT